MNIFSAMSSAIRNLTSQKSAGYGGDYPGVWTTVGGGQNGQTGINPASLLEANKEWVFIAVDKVAGSVAGLRFKAMRYQGNGNDQEVFAGPLVDFLENPSPGFTGKDFIYLNTVYKELTGNAFWEIGKANLLTPLVPSRVSPIVSDGVLIGYKYAEGASGRTIPLDKMLHDRYIDPLRPYWGAGKLQRIARWVDTSSYIGEFISRFFVNGATFGGFIETDEESEERIKLIKMGLQNDHVGVANAHKIGVLPKNSKYAKSTANMQEIEMGSTDDRYRDKILSTFGVPKTIIGLSTEVNRATAEASEYIFAKYTLKPVADDFLEFLNVNIAPILDPRGKEYFAIEEFVPENMDIMLKERAIALNNQPYMTVNEVRASASLPPVEGGDVIYTAPGLAPLGSPAPAPAPATPADTAIVPASTDTPKKAIPARLRATLKREAFADELVSKAMDFISAHNDPDAESHKNFVARVADYENLVENKVKDFNNRQEREVASRINQITKDVKKGDIFEFDSEVSVLVDFITPLLKGLMLEQAIAEFIDQAFPGTIDQSQPRINAIVDSAARHMAKSYNKTTATLLQKTLNEGIAKGDDVTQLTTRVKEIYDFSNSVRAKMVAQTETFYIANQGSREAFIQSGVVKSMRWYTAEDVKVCPWCGPLDGRVVGVTETFYDKGTVLTSENGKEMLLDYRDIDVPPLHPRCRCFIRPETIDIG